jgi:protein-S-isoprenylcysteine O-methyltransferase Ste14
VTPKAWVARCRRFLLWLNDLPIFDTARWPAREWGTRLVGIVAAAWFLYGRISAFPAYLRNIERMTAGMMDNGFSAAAARTVGALTVASGVLVVLIFLGYVLAWATRDRADDPARGFMEVVFPFIVAFLPLYITGAPQTLSRWLAPDGSAFISVVIMINVLMVGGFAMSFLSIVGLRRSFSFMAEARPLVRSGFFRWVRHPIYTGHFIMLLGVLVLHLGVRSVLAYAAVVIGHYYRARLEERKLIAVYPEYEEYRRTTGMFLPQRSYFGPSPDPVRMAAEELAEGSRSVGV